MAMTKPGTPATRITTTAGQKGTMVPCIGPGAMVTVGTTTRWYSPGQLAKFIRKG